MPDARYDFGLANSIEAEALGAPGQRRFRLLIESDDGNACLWVEKTQLIQLSILIGQMLKVPPSAGYTEAQSDQFDHPRHQNRHSVDFDVGNMILGHDTEKDLFSIEAHNRSDDQDMEPFLRFWTSRSQLADLNDRAQELCAAGRPICELCHTPINPGGHICPKSNGYNLH